MHKTVKIRHDLEGEVLWKQKIYFILFKLQVNDI